ncbi:MAG: hypothetical protein C5B50_09085 [Verrucomicrobia bacterium]|nr:MAG: hypothetical protein C5B50_09085 [Verrucomicrobiota bacterium]
MNRSKADHRPQTTDHNSRSPRPCLHRRLRSGISGRVFALGCSWIFSASLYASEQTPKSSIALNPSNAIPKIQFETNVFDFGKITAYGSITGVFKFKNVGDGILKLDRPQVSCDCTEAKVKPDQVASGNSGEVFYTIKLDRPLHGQRTIRVPSNDPKMPIAQLTIKLDYTPVYDLNPKSLRLTIPAGQDEAQGHFTVTRTDGKALDIGRLSVSQPWLVAGFDPSSKPEEGVAQINVTLRRPPNPAPVVTATVQLWTTNQPAAAVQTLVVLGEIQAELSATPSQLYWVIPDFGSNIASYPAESLVRKVELKSVLGRDVELKNPSTTIKGMRIQLVTTQPKKEFDLVLKFDELPQTFTKGTVTVETSLASVPKIEVPLIISVASAR